VSEGPFRDNAQRPFCPLKDGGNPRFALCSAEASSEPMRSPPTVLVAVVVALALALPTLATATVKRVSLTMPVRAGSYASLTVNVTPKSRCTIQVIYDTVISQAKGSSVRTAAWKSRCARRSEFPQRRASDVTRHSNAGLWATATRAEGRSLLTAGPCRAPVRRPCGLVDKIATTGRGVAIRVVRNPAALSPGPSYGKCIVGMEPPRYVDNKCQRTTGASAIRLLAKRQRT
jgi:hypothetical protein